MTISAEAKRAGAFSLVEVVLALGIVAFALVAILGVFPIGLHSDRSNIDDTHASSLARAITASLDAQATSFTSVDCFGLNLNLASLNNFDSTAPIDTLLYASYPEPGPPVITNASNPDSVYTIELQFENDPDLGNGVHLGAGKVSRVQIRIFGKSATPNSVEFSYLVRKRL